MDSRFILKNKNWKELSERATISIRRRRGRRRLHTIDAKAEGRLGCRQNWKCKSKTTDGRADGTGSLVYASDPQHNQQKSVRPYICCRKAALNYMHGPGGRRY